MIDFYVRFLYRFHMMSEVIKVVVNVSKSTDYMVYKPGASRPDLKEAGWIRWLVTPFQGRKHKN